MNVATEIKRVGDIQAALRARFDQLGITRETIDHAAGLPSGYAGKLFAERPIRSLGDISLFASLPVAGFKLLLVEDPDARAKYSDKLPRRPRRYRLRPSRAPKIVRISIERFSELGRLGAEQRNQNLTSEQRSKIARRAARARWKKKRVR